MKAVFTRTNQLLFINWLIETVLKRSLNFILISNYFQGSLQNFLVKNEGAQNKLQLTETKYEAS